MKILIFILSFFLVVGVKAAQMYQVKLDLSLNEKPAQSSIMTVATGDINTMTYQQGGIKNFVDVTVQEVKGKPDQLDMSFVIGEEKNKIRKVLSTPHVLAKIGLPAEVTVGGDNNKEFLKLKVLATKASR